VTGILSPSLGLGLARRFYLLIDPGDKIRFTEPPMLTVAERGHHALPGGTDRRFGVDLEVCSRLGWSEERFVTIGNGGARSAHVG
jgi:hypothetical protein